MIGRWLLCVILSFSFLAPLRAQEAVRSLDLLYPQFAHPRADAEKAIAHRDFRFITTNRQRTIVPGIEGHRRLRRIYHTKYVRQPFRIFVTRSENFSFNLRAEAYARAYNQVLVDYLLTHHEKKK